MDTYSTFLLPRSQNKGPHAAHLAYVDRLGRAAYTGIRRKQVAYGPAARWQERQSPAAVIVSPAAGVFERGCGVDGPAGRRGSACLPWKRRTHLSPSAPRGRLRLSAPARRAGERAGRGSRRRNHLYIGRARSSPPLPSGRRGVSPSVTRGRLRSGRHLSVGHTRSSPIRLSAPRSAVQAGAAHLSVAHTHGNLQTPVLHSGWPVCYAVYSSAA
jgi:hypothetical protein